MSTEYEYIWFRGGREHRRTLDPEGDKPIHITLSQNSEVVLTYWDDGDGPLHDYEYLKDGEIHRGGDKPAEGVYSLDGDIEFEGYMHEGFYHRDGDKPSKIFLIRMA